MQYASEKTGYPEPRKRLTFDSGLLFFFLISDS